MRCVGARRRKGREEEERRLADRVFNMADFLMATYHKVLIFNLSKITYCLHRTKNHLSRASRSLSWILKQVQAASLVSGKTREKLNAKKTTHDLARFVFLFLPFPSKLIGVSFCFKGTDDLFLVGGGDGD